MRPKRGIVYHKARNTPPPLLMPTPDVVTEADNAALIAAAHGVPAVALERKVDLDQLRLNYRRAMNERQATTAAVEKKIQHQTQLLRRLEEEQAMLRKRISAETALTNTPQDAALSAQLEQKQQELEQLTATLQQQEQQVQSAEKHRAQREETLIQLRNRLSLATQRRTSSEYIDKTTAALERKLELAQNARSEIEAQNTKMREDISELLRKRDEFVHEREELQDQTLQVKQDAQQAVAVSQAAYERRELLRSTLSTLLADEEAGIQEHNAAYRSVTEALNATLAQEAVSAAPPERRPVTGEIRDRSLSPPARNVSSAARNEEIRLQLQMLAEQVGVPIEDLARTYTDREDKNYGLYGFASELEVEVERVTERLNLLRTQVAQRDSNVQQIETEDIQQVADTQKRLEQIETDTVAATQRRDQAVQALDQAVKAATTLADQLGVESAMDGGSADAPVILGRIEDAVTAMLLKVGGLVHRGALPPAVFISRQDIESERLAQTGILSHGAGQAGSGSNIALPSTETRDQDGVLKSTTIADAAYAQEDEVFEAVVGKGQGRRSSIPLTLDDIRNLVSTSMFTENDVLEEELA